MIIENFTLNGTNWGDAEVQASRYVAGGIALRVVDAETREPLTTLSVWMETPPADGCFWLKSWGENDGLALMLGTLGLVEYTGEICPTGYVHAIEARPKGELKNLVDTQVAKWER